MEQLFQSLEQAERQLILSGSTQCDAVIASDSKTMINIDALYKILRAVNLGQSLDESILSQADASCIWKLAIHEAVESECMSVLAQVLQIAKSKMSAFEYTQIVVDVAVLPLLKGRLFVVRTLIEHGDLALPLLAALFEPKGMIPIEDAVKEMFFKDLVMSDLAIEDFERNLQDVSIRDRVMALIERSDPSCPVLLAYLRTGCSVLVEPDQEMIMFAIRFGAVEHVRMLLGAPGFNARECKDIAMDMMAEALKITDPIRMVFMVEMLGVELHFPASVALISNHNGCLDEISTVNAKALVQNGLLLAACLELLPKNHVLTSSYAQAVDSMLHQLQVQGNGDLDQLYYGVCGDVEKLNAIMFLAGRFRLSVDLLQVAVEDGKWQVIDRYNQVMMRSFSGLLLAPYLEMVDMQALLRIARSSVNDEVCFKRFMAIPMVAKNLFTLLVLDSIEFDVNVIALLCRFGPIPLSMLAVGIAHVASLLGAPNVTEEMRANGQAALDAMCCSYNEVDLLDAAIVAGQAFAVKVIVQRSLSGKDRLVTFESVWRGSLVSWQVLSALLEHLDRDAKIAMIFGAARQFKQRSEERSAFIESAGHYMAQERIRLSDEEAAELRQSIMD